MTFISVIKMAVSWLVSYISSLEFYTSSSAEQMLADVTDDFWSSLSKVLRMCITTIRLGKNTLMNCIDAMTGGNAYSVSHFGPGPEMSGSDSNTYLD